MNFWDYLNKAGERRLKRPNDTRILVGALFLAGYYLMVYRFMSANIPNANVPLIRDAMLVLGPPVGAIVAALFRNDIRDEQQTQNTGAAFRAIEAAANANSAASGAKED